MAPASGPSRCRTIVRPPGSPGRSRTCRTSVATSRCPLWTRTREGIEGASRAPERTAGSSRAPGRTRMPSGELERTGEGSAPALEREKAPGELPRGEQGQERSRREEGQRDAPRSSSWPLRPAVSVRPLAAAQILSSAAAQSWPCQPPARLSALPECQVFSLLRASPAKSGPSRPRSAGCSPLPRHPDAQRSPGECG